MINSDEHLVSDLFGELEQKKCRAGFGDALVQLGEQNQDVVVLTADLAGSTNVGAFHDSYPDRFFQVGVAEQNMMGIAAGLALAGKVPFTASYATFSPGRSWDQLRVSVAYTQANVKVVGAHAGLSVGPDGATHQALEDLAITRVLPNLTVVASCDYQQTIKAVHALADLDGPCYLRFGRTATPAFTTTDSPFRIGRAEVLRDGDDLTILACGPLSTKPCSRRSDCTPKTSRRVSWTATRSNRSTSLPSPRRLSRPAPCSPSKNTRSMAVWVAPSPRPWLCTPHPAGDGRHARPFR